MIYSCVDVPSTLIGWLSLLMCPAQMESFRFFSTVHPM